MNVSILSGYSWLELWSPVTFAAVVLLSIIYYKRMVVSSRYVVTKRQITYLYIAAAFLYIVKGSPLKVIADKFLFSAHVFEIMALLFIVLPLFILSMPAEWARKYFWNHRLKLAIKIFGHPWMAALLFNGALTAYFVPRFFNIIHESLLLTTISQLFLVFTGFLMWWTIIMPLPEINQFSYFTRVAYIFLNAILLMPIGIFLLIVISQVHYPVYEATATRFIPSMTAVYDQQLGGGLLKAIQLVSYVIALFYLVKNWSRKEDEKEGQVEDENIRVVQGVVIHLPKK